MDHADGHHKMSPGVAPGPADRHRPVRCVGIPTIRPGTRTVLSQAHVGPCPGQAIPPALTRDNIVELGESSRNRPAGHSTPSGELLFPGRPRRPLQPLEPTLIPSPVVGRSHRRRTTIRLKSCDYEDNDQPCHEERAHDTPSLRLSVLGRCSQGYHLPTGSRRRLGPRPLLRRCSPRTKGNRSTRVQGPLHCSCGVRFITVAPHREVP